MFPATIEMRFLFAALIASVFGTAAPNYARSLNFDSPVALGSINTDKVTEASGIAVSLANPGVFYTHNDGSSHHIYACLYDGTFLASFDFNKSTTDTEDIATGPGPDPSLHYIYIGDIGSNNSSRDTVKIFRAAEPAVDSAWANDPPALNLSGVDTVQLHYPDGKYDAEALLVDPIQKALYIATKQPTEARLYRFNLSDFKDGKTFDLQFVVSIPFSVASAGAISSDGLTIAIRREDFALGWTRDPNESVESAVGREGTIIPVIGPPTEPNGEAIDFLPDGSGYITTSEGLNPTVYFFRRLSSTCNDAPQFTDSPQFTATGLALNFTGCPGSNLAIERSTDLSAWQQIGTATVSATGASSSFTDPQPTAPAYYRLRVIP